MECGHHSMSDFKASAHEWVCSGCGRVGLWNNAWSYFGAIGCRKCGQEPVIDFVACSESCRRKHEAGKRVESRSLVEESLTRVNGRIETLQQEREGIKRRLERMRK